MSSRIISVCGFRTALLSSVAGTLALAALAGQAAAATAAGEILVTGTRIPQKNLVTTSPVLTVGAQDVNTQGVTRVEDLTNSLPQVFAGQNANISNGSNGTATVDLRGLGSKRTLTLVDGKRLAYGSPTSSPAADINQIPGKLIDRIEILTGGASAVYGSDALSGVVNFIMKKDYEGLQIDAQYGTYQHTQTDGLEGSLDSVLKIRGLTNPAQFRSPKRDITDGASREISIIAGTSTGDNKGHVEAYFTWRKNEAVLQANRNFSACTIGGQNKANFNGGLQPIAGFPANTQFRCGGSATASPAAFTNFATFDYSIDPTTGNTFIAGHHGLLDPNDVADQYNFGPLNYYQRPDERYSFGAFSNYNITPGIEMYAQLMLTDYNSNAQIAPSGAFFNTSTISCGNPLLSNSQATTLGCTAADIANSRTFDQTGAGADVNKNVYIGRRNTEGGGRQDYRNLWSYRTTVGFRGGLWDGWNYDLSGQRSRTSLSQVYRNDFSVTKLLRSFDVIDPDGAGPLGPTCRSVKNGTDKSCVPYNVFTLSGFTGGFTGAETGGVSAAALAYLQTPLLQQAAETQTIVNGTVTGDLSAWGFKSPWADDGVKTALGFEVRRDEVTDTVDNTFNTGDGAGQGGPTKATQGATDLWELFSELEIPLVQNAPFAKQIKIDGAYRYSSYDTHIHTHTYKIGADWAPTDDVRLRASYQRSVRAANVLELFAPQAISLFGTSHDPCSAAAGATRATLAQCVATGITPAQYAIGNFDSPAGQYNNLLGGNTALKPEIGRTLTAGIVFTPTFAPGLVASVDYFNIRINKQIGALAGSQIFTACYTFNIAAQCALIHRNGAGNIWTGNGFLTALNQNLGGLVTSGVDVSVAYTYSLADAGLGNWGSLNASIIGTWLESLLTIPSNGPPSYECAGFYGAAGTGVGHESCGSPNPEWRHKARLTWDTPWHFDLTGTWRYFASVDLHGAPTSSINGQLGAFLDKSFEAISYFDLESNVHLTKRVELRVGANNILDKDPPLTSYSSISAGVNGNTFPAVYDALGRLVFAGITIDL